MRLQHSTTNLRCKTCCKGEKKHSKSARRSPDLFSQRGRTPKPNSVQDAYNAYIEKLRAREYPSLLNTTYLDHAGTTLYSSSLIDAYHHDLKTNLFGNPHSDSPSSDLSTRRVDQARIDVLEYFNASANHFDVVFTANATAAIKLVGDCFRDQEFWYGYHKDAHNSLVGLREIASASQCFISNESVERWLEQRRVSSDAQTLSLFAYPAQSNMTGYRLPLSWSKRIRDTRKNQTRQDTFVLLDAASYLTSGRLDLEDHKGAPDFICLSFYKIFGFPDLGALLVKKSAQEVLSRRRYFGGGTVDSVTVINDAFYLSKTQAIHDFLEDGTLPFHSIVALTHAIAIHKRLFRNAASVSRHTAYLSAWLYWRLSSLKHFNGRPVVKVYQDVNSRYGDAATQGPILAFNVLQSDGTYVGKSHFERLAIEANIQIRTGGVCNPGGIATMIPLRHWEIRRNASEGVRCGSDIDVMGGLPTGIVRVSLGPMSTMGDVMRFADFVECLFVDLGPQRRHDGPIEISPSRVIIPVEGCSGVEVDEKDYPAYQIWHNQWCIVDSRTTKQIPWTHLHFLETSIEPVAGILRFFCPNAEDLTVSLWSAPQQSIAAPHSTAEHRYFDTYSEVQINDWLTTNIGRPCQLARYRREDVDKSAEATTCVIPRCSQGRTSHRRELLQHYKAHAAGFTGQYSVENQGMKRSPIKLKRSMPEMLVIWKTQGKTSIRVNCREVDDPSHDVYDVKEIETENSKQGRKGRLEVIARALRIKVIGKACRV